MDHVCTKEVGCYLSQIQQHVCGLYFWSSVGRTNKIAVRWDVVYDKNDISFTHVEATPHSNYDTKMELVPLIVLIYH